MIVSKVTLENFELPLSAGVLSARARARARARAGPSELRGLPALPTRETTLQPLCARANLFGKAPRGAFSLLKLKEYLHIVDVDFAPKMIILKLDI